MLAGPTCAPRAGLAALLVGQSLLAACGQDRPTHALTSVQAANFDNIQVPAEDGPKLAAVANLTPILNAPDSTASRAGYLHAGARVSRSEQPIEAPGCKAGWYAVRPRGFVCLDHGATLDMNHPTLGAMALEPNLLGPLPYTYAKARVTTDLYSVDRDHPGRVKTVSKLPRQSRMAVVGTWAAKDEHDTQLRLAVLPSGAFVAAANLEQARVPEFAGIELNEQLKLPLAFVVKRGVRSFKLGPNDTRPEAGDPLDFHEKVELSGRYRDLEGVQYWATNKGGYVRHQDVTLIRVRNVFPDFATEDQRWIDISVAMGTLVLYEGKKPVFATLVSVGRDRLEEGAPAATTRGTFEIIAAHITHVELDPTHVAEGYEVYNVPWALELSSGQMLHGAFWHDRFGIEFGPGNVELAPADAHRVWAWAHPELPTGWHAAYTRDGQKRVRVVVRT